MIIILTNTKKDYNIFDRMQRQLTYQSDMIIQTNGKRFRFVKNRQDWFTIRDKSFSNRELQKTIDQQIKKELIQQF